MFITSVVCAVFLSGMLQFLAFFHLINWQPTSLVTSSIGRFTGQPLILFILLILLLLLYFWGWTMLLYQFPNVPTLFMSLILTVITFYLIEWVLNKQVHLDTLVQMDMVPLLALLAIVFRIIVGTTVFYKEQLK